VYLFPLNLPLSRRMAEWVKIKTSGFRTTCMFGMVHMLEKTRRFILTFWFRCYISYTCGIGLNIYS
jgi:hypothetical protein